MESIISLLKGNVIMDLQAKDHDAALYELVEHLVLNNKVSDENKQAIINAILKREGQVSTSIGFGVAIPHVFLDCVTKPIFVFGKSSEGIEFQSIDNSPVKYILLFVMPESHHSQHLLMLAKLSKCFSKADYRAQLASSDCEKEIIELLSVAYLGSESKSFS